jgi:hypothetical protein
MPRRRGDRVLLMIAVGTPVARWAASDGCPYRDRQSVHTPGCVSVLHEPVFSMRSGNMTIVSKRP